MRVSRFTHAQVWLSLLLVLLPGVGCNDDGNEDIVVNATLKGENAGPSIVLAGPDYPGAMTSSVYSISPWWVLVADKDGLDDISAVFLDVQSIALNGVIARPDVSSDPPNYCGHGPDYTDNNDLDITAALPASFPGLEHSVMSNGYAGGGIYHSPNLIPGIADPYEPQNGFADLSHASATFLPTQLQCYNGPFYVFRVGPPTLPSEMDVFITQVDVTFQNVSITVYDFAGQKATVSVPDLRVVYRSEREAQTLP